jgi:hypothetical protein
VPCAVEEPTARFIGCTMHQRALAASTRFL